MKRFRVTHKVTKIYEINVDADNKEEASIKASYSAYTDRESMYAGQDFDEEIVEINCDGDVLNA